MSRGNCPDCLGDGSEVPWLTANETPCPTCSGSGGAPTSSATENPRATRSPAPAPDTAPEPSSVANLVPMTPERLAEIRAWADEVPQGIGPAALAIALRRIDELAAEVERLNRHTRKALDARWALLLRCRALVAALRLVERDGRVGPAHYELQGGQHLSHVAALLVAIDLEGETADPLTGERPTLPSGLPSMPVEDADPRAGRRT